MKNFGRIFIGGTFAAAAMGVFGAMPWPTAAPLRLEAMRGVTPATENMKADLVDMHCDTIGRFMSGEDLRQDLPRGQVDIPKLKRGGVALQVFACYAPPPATDLEKARSAEGVFAQVEAVGKFVAENPNDLEIVRTTQDFARVRGAGKIGLLIGIEGGYAIENDLDRLRAFYRAGVRLMTLTHWTRTDWADASGDARPELGGLTAFGEDVVREMNRLGMIVDVSHVHDETFWDVIRISAAPVVASHSCARALADHHRNLSDEMLKALAKNEGVVGINFSAGFLNAGNDIKRQALWEGIARKHGLPLDYRSAMKSPSASRDKAAAEYNLRSEELRKSLAPVDVRTLADHIDHVVRVTGGADHVGLGSDFDGISETPAGLENAGKFPAVTAELVRRGYGEDAIRKILGANVLRVFAAVEKAARR